MFKDILMRPAAVAARTSVRGFGADAQATTGRCA
jgi:hypothetical protein